MLVVEAYRSLEAASATHVEAVGRAATQLPGCTACPFSSDHSSGGASEAPAGNSSEGIEEVDAATTAFAESAARIAELGADAGVLHLAMHSNGAQGLVSSWRTDVVAIAEPSARLLYGSTSRRNLRFRLSYAHAACMLGCYSLSNAHIKQVHSHVRM